MGGGNQSHNHIYESKFDDINHWKECLICKDIIDSTPHVLTSKNTATYSCSVFNTRITSCSDCAYTKEEPYQTNHTYSYIGHYCNSNGPYFFNRCGICEEEYDMSFNGYKYYQNGIEANPNTIMPGATITNSNGNSTRIDCLTKRTGWSPELFSCNYNISGNTIYVSYTFKVPDEIKQILTASQIRNTNQYKAYQKDVLTNNNSLTLTSSNYDESTGIITANFSSSNLVSSTKDRSSLGFLSLSVDFYKPINGGYYQYSYSSKVYVDYEETKPSITEVK